MPDRYPIVGARCLFLADLPPRDHLAGKSLVVIVAAVLTPGIAFGGGLKAQVARQGGLAFHEILALALMGAAFTAAPGAAPGYR